MRCYTLFVSAFEQQEDLHVDFFADTPASAFDWVEENAPGLDFELFEDGRSVARVHHASDEVRAISEDPVSPE